MELQEVGLREMGLESWNNSKTGVDCVCVGSKIHILLKCE
jgi:hypothetical protein